MNRPANCCCCCGHAMKSGLEPWHRFCEHCAYEAADLQPAINDSHTSDTLSESDRETGLKTLRVENFQSIIAELRRLGLRSDARLLDVGCAHGWFLDAASRWCDVVGIEPDEAVSAYTRGRGFDVRYGYFPDAIGTQEQFDVIVFNDVIEHIPNVGDALQCCFAHLNPGGMLVLNLPSSKGIFFRISKLLARIGRRTPFQRMWQYGYPSPHLHYFNDRNLKQLVESHGLQCVYQGELKSVTHSGLFERIYYGGEYNRAWALVLFFCLTLAMPLISVMPGDIQLHIYRKPGV